MGERKYQQRGYRERPEPARRPAPARPEPPASPDRRELPRGRGLGAPTEDVFRCARCGTTATVAAAAAPEARCEKCGSDLHSCTNCAHFEPSARFECRVEIPARMAPKDRANRCDRFEPRLRREVAQEKARPSDARSAFDALFKI